MYKLSMYAYVAAFLAFGLAALLYLWYAVGSVKLRALQYSTPLGKGGARTVMTRGEPPRVAPYATLFAVNGTVFLGLSLLLRSIAAGRGPFSNMYEFTVAFAFGTAVVYLLMERHYQIRNLSTVILPIILALLAYSATVPSEIRPLIPALQNNLLLTIHVAVAIFAYGGFATAFGVAVLYFVQRKWAFSLLPRADVLDDIGYRSVVVGFPMMALVIILGAWWADIAWGSYWSWDPKETASLVTWLIYGAYLHTRTLKHWQGTRSAAFLVLGFAAVLMTYFGNYVFGGLHSYAI